MRTFLIILIIIFVAGPFLIRLLLPYIQRWAAGKMEDQLRRRMGMPSRKEEQRMRREAERRQTSDARRSADEGRYGTQRPSESRRRRRYHHTGPIIPKEYAEDVEFTEIKTFEQTEISGVGDDRTQQREWHESQIEDAEYIEVKKSK